MVKRLAVFIFILSLIGATYAKDVNTDVLLRCISQVESNDVSTKIGKHGERSQYQFTIETWVMYSDYAFGLIGGLKYQNEVESVAKRHVETIKKILIERGISVNSYNIALAWNGGPNKKFYLPRNKEYARRVVNLYEFYFQ